MRKPSRRPAPPKPRATPSEKPRKHWLREWAEALVFAFLVTAALHLFVFQPFVVPTPSMAGTIVPGDYVVVSKLHYGARTPHTVGIPYTDLYIPGLTLPSVRLPGFSEVRRGDVVVFNLPPEDRPVDRKTPYLKRIVGLPGDVVEVRDKVVYAGGAALPVRATMQQAWRVYKHDARVALPADRLRALGITDVYPTADPSLVVVHATAGAADALRAWPYVARVEPYRAGPGFDTPLFPAGSAYTPDDYGPVAVPRTGATVALTAETWPLYETLIRHYEGHPARRRDDGTFEVDGAPADRYTFAQDYYFVMGDNRDNSEDSRFWGFVPADHLIGKTVATFFSWDGEAHHPRFGRMFRPVR